MFDLSDIDHLPELDEAVAQLAADGPGLIAIAGLDLPLTSSSDEFPLPSGRTSLFRILARRLLRSSDQRAVILTFERDFIRIARGERGRVEVIVVNSADETRARLVALKARPPKLVIIERMEDAGVATAALELAGCGAKVLTQLSTPSRGLGVARTLLKNGLPQELIAHLSWVVAVRRVPALCQVCAIPVPADSLEMAELRTRFPVPIPLPTTVRRAAGCQQCGGSGNQGEVFLFDVYQPSQRRSVISYEMYALKLASQGSLSVDDVLDLEAAPLQQAHALRVASEQAFREATSALQRKVAELESAHRVSEQRTEALVSLQRMSEVLLSDATPRELAAHICRQARELCGAERVVLYAVARENAEALGEAGWGPDRLPGPQPIEQVCGTREEGETPGGPTPFAGWPPGIAARPPDVEGAVLRAGLRVALVAQGEMVGAIYVHSTIRSSFAPGHIALLQTFAAQAALALQRAALTAELRAKVAELEAAQAELAVKARLARELELARQVQQSFLPRTFPALSGYAFAAFNEPAREVGGDFYDVIDLGADRVGLVIADVSDKGIAAALYMALSRSLIRAEATREVSPRTVLVNVNRLLLELGEPGMFVSVFYGVLDGAKGTLTYSRAGHDRPLILRSGAAQPLGGQGLLLGVFEEIDLSLTEEQLTLASGDRLILYTDGLIDVRDADGNTYGEDRLIALLMQHTSDAGVAMCANVARELNDYCGEAEQADDMTLLVVDVL